MKITFFSATMSIVCGNILIIIYAFLRKKSVLVDICSLSGIVLLYIFCAFRMFIPVEFPWVMVIHEPHIYNSIYSVFCTDIGIMDLKVIHIVIVFWIIGTIIGLAKLFIRYQKYRYLFDIISGGGTVVDNNQFGIDDMSIKIIKTSLISTPISFGINKKRILIPADKYTEIEEKLIIKHEYMHIKNHDLIVQLLINILCALYWWNPFVYLLRLDLGQYFELRCDSNVAQNMSDNQVIEYLEVLLKAYKMTGYDSSNNISLGFMGVRGRTNLDIKERFNYLALGTNKKHKLIGKTTAFIIALTLMVISYTFIIQPVFEAPITEFEDDGSICYEVTMTNSYLIKMEDGSYILHTENGDEDDVSAEIAILMIEEGYGVVEYKGEE